MTNLFHSDGFIEQQLDVGEYIGSPLYQVIPEHGAAFVAALLLLAGGWWLRRTARRGGPRSVALVGAYRQLSPVHRFLAWLLLTSSAIHAGLVLGHEASFYTVLYLSDALALFIVGRRLINGQNWRRWARLVLFASILGYAFASFAGEPPDQLGMATKLIELTALGIALTPTKPGRVRRLVGSTATVLVVVITGLAGWIGAFGSGEGGHHLGEVPPPGVLLPPGEDREPTAAEQHEADELYADTVAATAKYQDPAVAAEDGYNVDGITGQNFHAQNPAHKNDGRIFDPEHPENLIYAVGPTGPVLIGVMFEMDNLGDVGPAVGGPLTVWHAHDHLCFSLTPPALVGLTSPFGYCPAGSVTIPVTNEMIHLWTLPGVPDEFGDLEDSWLTEYLAALA